MEKIQLVCIKHAQIEDKLPSESAAELWPRIAATWHKSQFVPVELPPKIHISSPKNDKDVRAHADHVELEHVWPFLREVASTTPAIDVMIEAKRKDEALLKLMDGLRGTEGVEVVDQASVRVNG